MPAVRRWLRTRSAGTWSEGGLLPLALVVSSVAHAATGLGMPTGRGAAAAAADPMGEVEFIVTEVPAPREERPEPPAPRPEPPAPRSEPPAHEAQPLAIATRTPTTLDEEPERHETDDATDEATGDPAASLVMHETIRPDEEREPRRRPLPSLDPRSVAMGAVTFDMPVDTPRENTDRARSEALSASLRADTRAGHLSRRGPPELHRRRDGSYDYDGAGFRARISPDGRVEFSDREGMDYDGGGDLERVASARFRFGGLSDRMDQRRGNDPYAAERSWFMRETETLRHRLEQETRSHDMERALRSLRGRLIVLWRDDDRPAEAKREAIFRMWRDCAPDEEGARARAVIEAFVRERLPRGTPGAYPEDELERINRTLTGAGFRPYGRNSN